MRWVHPGACGHVIPGKGYRSRGPPCRLWTLVQSLGGGVRLETGYEIPYMWSWKGVTWRWWRCGLRYRVCEGVHCGDCGHVTPSTGSRVGCQPEDTGYVTPGAGSGRRSLWRFWMSYSRYSLWGHVSPYRQWKYDPRCRFRKGSPCRL